MTSVGQPIAALIAADQATAQRAAKLVKVDYRELPPVVTIEEAIAADSYHHPPLVIKKGDAEAALKDSEHVIEGTARNGAQEHFYLETNAILTVPNREKV